MALSFVLKTLLMPVKVFCYLLIFKEVPLLAILTKTYTFPPEFLSICEYNSGKKLHVTDLSKMDIL